MSAQWQVLSTLVHGEFYAGAYKQQALMQIQANEIKRALFTDEKAQTLFDAIEKLAFAKERITPKAIERASDGAFAETVVQKLLSKFLPSEPNEFPNAVEDLRDDFLRKTLARIAKNAPEKNLAQYIQHAADELRGSTEISAQIVGHRQGVMETLDAMERARLEKRSPYFKTGFAAIDSKIYGFVPGLNVVAGHEGVGKSAFLATVLHQAIGRGDAVGLIGLEDGFTWAFERMIARGSGVPLFKLYDNSLTDEKQGEITKAAKSVYETSGGVVSYSGQDKKPDAVCAAMIAMVKKHGARAVFIDHGGELEFQHDDSVRWGIKMAISRIRDTALMLGVPAVLFWHFNRDFRGDELPEGHHLAESHWVARMSRQTHGLFAAQVGQEDVLALRVIKNTRGPKGQLFYIERHAESATVDAGSAYAVEARAEA